MSHHETAMSEEMAIRLYRVCKRVAATMSRKEHVREDLASIAFLRVMVAFDALASVDESKIDAFAAVVSRRAIDSDTRRLVTRMPFNPSGDSEYLFSAPKSDQSQADLAEAINARLNPQERAVLAMYCGLNGEEPMNRREIARSIRCGQEAVTQTIDSAIAKLREALS